MGTKSKLGIVAGLAAAAVGAYYFYYSKHAKKNRARAKAWMVQAEREVMDKVEELKDAAFNEENYKRIVDAVSARYREVRGVTVQELEEFISVLNGAWKEIEKRASKAERTAKKGLHRIAKEVRK